jgi:peptidoglycan/xylan/chitin deacetylase (PgdA/CDA1 family)
VYFGDDDTPAPDGRVIARRIIGAVQPGSIILLHDGFTHRLHHEVPETVKALRIFVPALQAQGYEFVTVSTILGIDAYKGCLPMTDPYSAALS